MSILLFRLNYAVAYHLFNNFVILVLFVLLIFLLYLLLVRTELITLICSIIFYFSMSDPFLFPFSHLSNDDLALTFSSTSYNSLNFDNDLKHLLTNMLTDDIVTSTEFKYYTPTQFDYFANKYKTSIQ